MARPTAAERALVLETAEEAAKTYGADVDDVLGMERTAPAINARYLAWRQIRDFGWSAERIARVWGCDPQAVRQAKPARKETYDPRTVHQLHWLHGENRAAAIIRGVDSDTNADLAAWKRLCALGGAR